MGGSMTNQSKKERRADRKARDKELLNKYKDVAPKGPGFSWKAKIIFGLVGILFIIGFLNIKTLYIGNTPIKILDYSLTRSLSADGRDINVSIEAKYRDHEPQWLAANIQYTFEYIKAFIELEGSNTPDSKVFLNTDMLAVQNESWEKYDFDQLVINDHIPFDWQPLEQVLDARSIPAIQDTLEEYAQYFLTQYYDRFYFGEETIIETKEKTYNTQRINLVLTEEDIYPLLRDFIAFNDQLVDFREGIKDRIQRFLTTVQEENLYESLDLDPIEVQTYLDNFEEEFELTYILMMSDLQSFADAQEAIFKAMDFELTLSFFVDKDYKVRAVEGQFKNLISDQPLEDITIRYVVNNFKQGYIENPVEFKDNTTSEEVNIEDILHENHLLTYLLTQLYNGVF